MTVPRSVADVLADHVVLEVESIDPMYCNLYVPKLQHVNGVVWFFRGHLGMPFASSALMDPISKRFVASIHRFCRDHDVPMVDFVKGQRKDDVAHEYLARFTGEEGVLFIGRAQEKTPVFRTERRRNPETGASYPWIVSSTGVVNHFYVYALDAGLAPFFMKFSSYFPYTAKLCINGNEYAKRMAAKAGLGSEALDNGFASCDDPAALQRICDRLSPAKIDGLVRKWLRRRPHPFTAADRAAGYRYDIFHPAGRLLPDPDAGPAGHRADLLRRGDPGESRPGPSGQGRSGLQPAHRHQRPAQNPGTVPDPGAHRRGHPSMHVDSENTKVKQYHKLDRDLRTETTINDSRDFGIGKRLCNLPALREVGFSANRRLLAVQRLTHDPVIGAYAISALTSPTLTPTGTRVPALPLDSPRTQALLAALIVFRLLPHGFRNRDLRAHLAPLLGTTADTMTAGQLSYDLRRLRHHGLVERVPGTHRYTIPDHGLHLALFLTRNHARVLHPGLSHILDPHAIPTPIRRHLDRFTTATDDYARKHKFIA
jgi:hypothetical protein